MRKFKIAMFLISFFMLLSMTALAIDGLAQKHYEKGYKLIDENKIDEAVAELQESIKIEPNYADAHQELGVVYFRKGMLDKATTELRKAVELEPGDPGAWTSLGSVYSNRGLPILAVKMLEKAIEIAPDYAEAHYDIAYVYFSIAEKRGFNKDVLDRIIMHVEKYQALIPAAAKLKQNIDFLDSLKKKRREAGNIAVVTVPETQDDLARLKISRDTAENLADTISGKTDEEREIAERVGLMMDLMQRDEVDEALKESEEILRLSSQNKEALVISAAIYHKKGLYDMSIPRAKVLIESYPDLSMGYDVLARSYYKKGDTENFSEMMTTLRMLDPGMADDLQGQIDKGTIK